MYICIYVCIHKDVVFAMFVQTQIISCRCLVLPHSKYISICIIYTYIYIFQYPYASMYLHVFYIPLCLAIRPCLFLGETSPWRPGPG